VPTEGPKVFVEGDNDDDDDEVEVVTESVPDFAPSGMGDSLSGDGQGALVKDILSAQKQLAKGAEGAAETEEEAAPASTGIVLKRRGSSKNVTQPAGAKGATDLGKLRESIQALCQSTMPLGKSMDYLQEDLENMKKELKFWMNEHRVYQEKLTEQQRYTEELLNPQVRRWGAPRRLKNDVHE
jgi:TRAF3-interacting protein 1